MLRMMVFSAIDLKLYSLESLMKARREYPEGTVRAWKTGTFKKVGGKWVRVARPDEQISSKSEADEIGAEKAAKLEEKAEQMYNAAVYDHGIMSLVVLDILEEEGVRSFEDLKRRLAKNPSDEASKLYKNVYHGVRKELIEEYGMALDKNDPHHWSDPYSREAHLAGDALTALKKLALSMTTTRDLYSKPKAKLMVKVEGKKDHKVKAGGKQYSYSHKYEYVEPKKVWAAPQIKEAKEMTGGWTDMSKQPSPAQARKMIDQGRVFRGKFDPKRSIEFGQRRYFTRVPGKSDATYILATMQQSKKKKGAKRSQVVFEAQVKIPFVYADDFLKHQIKGNKTAAGLKREMESSEAYKKTREVTDYYV